MRSSSTSSRAEAAAEDRVGDLRRQQLGIVARHRDRADPDLRLARVRLVHQQDAARGERRGRSGPARYGVGTGLPGAEGLAHAREGVRRRDVADHRQDRVVGMIPALVEVAHVAPPEAGDALPVAVLPASVRVGAVEEGREALLGDRRRILERRDQIGELRVASAPHLVGCEGGLAQHLPEQIETGREVVTQELAAHDGAVGPGIGSDRAPERLHRAREVLGRELPRAAREQVRGQRGQSFLARRILRRARTDHGVELDERHLVRLGDDEP